MRTLWAVEQYLHFNWSRVARGLFSAADVLRAVEPAVSSPSSCSSCAAYECCARWRRKHGLSLLCWCLTFADPVHWFYSTRHHLHSSRGMYARASTTDAPFDEFHAKHEQSIFPHPLVICLWPAARPAHSSSCQRFEISCDEKKGIHSPTPPSETSVNRKKKKSNEPVITTLQRIPS